MYAARNTLSRLRAHGTPHQSGNMPTLLLTRLASAPAWASACSLGAYLYLWVRGIGHALTLLGLHDNSLLAHALSEDSLRADVALLVALYGVESAAAFVLGRSTLYAWRRCDFLLHHAPYAAVVGTATWLRLVTALSPAARRAEGRPRTSSGSRTGSLRRCSCRAARARATRRARPTARCRPRP